MGSSPCVLDAVVIPLVLGPSILDVGCGFGRWGALLTTNYWETHLAEPGTRPSITGCDGYLPNVELARQSGFYTEVTHTLFPPLPFANDSFETVLLLDIVEHLDSKDGSKLIDEAKRIASRRVILSTPNWPAFRGGHATVTGWNDLEAHLSYWSRGTLRDLGFRLYGAGWHPGKRYWRGALRRARLLPLYDATIRPNIASLSRCAPFFAENLVGMWQKKQAPNNAG
ncbi:MAG TPA: class I SAM-dependent methyltransferase [Syntrophorhabdales bacterium]|nr:class I SAM-dependent methyltransferase [Syntrophorhabdales bacterium]